MKWPQNERLFKSPHPHEIGAIVQKPQVQVKTVSLSKQTYNIYYNTIYYNQKKQTHLDTNMNDINNEQRNHQVSKQMSSLLHVSASMAREIIKSQNFFKN